MTLPSARRLAVAVVVVVAGFVALDAAFAGSHGAPIGAYTTRGAYSFVTEPSLHPPKLRGDGTTAPASELAPGYIFTANFYNLNYPPLVGQSGPLILDRNLQPVWFQPVPEKVVASNLSLQTYEGKPALAWWQGVVTNTGATESGEDVVVNQHYQTVARLHGTDGWKLTLHEIVISGDDAWVTANKNIAKNLSNYGGAYNGALIDSAVQEYNLKTGKLLRSWDALDHIPLGDSRATRADERLPLGRLPRQLDRPDGRRHVPRLDAQHLGRLPRQHRDGQDRVDARRQALELQVRPGRRLPVAARRRAAAPSSTVTMFDDHCCQLTGGGTYVPADRALARARAEARPAGAHRDARCTSTRGGDDFESDYMGDTQPLRERQRVRRLGLGAVLLRVQPLGQAAARSANFPGTDLSYRATRRAVGRPAAHRARGRRAPGGRQDDGVRELERRHPGRLLAGPRRAPSGGSALTAVASRRQVRLRDGDRGAGGLPELRGAGARRERPRDRSLASVHAVGSMADDDRRRGASLPAALAHVSVGVAHERAGAISSR